jgi:hypothetical protein
MVMTRRAMVRRGVAAVAALAVAPDAMAAFERGAALAEFAADVCPTEVFTSRGLFAAAMQVFTPELMAAGTVDIRGVEKLALALARRARSDQQFRATMEAEGVLRPDFETAMAEAEAHRRMAFGLFWDAGLQAEDVWTHAQLARWPGEHKPRLLAISRASRLLASPDLRQAMIEGDDLRPDFEPLAWLAQRGKAVSA